jgi:hypothetical protein
MVPDPGRRRPAPADASEQLKGGWLQKNLPGQYTLVMYGFDVGVNAATNGNLILTFLTGKLYDLRQGNVPEFKAPA